MSFAPEKLQQVHWPSPLPWRIGREPTLAGALEYLRMSLERFEHRAAPRPNPQIDELFDALGRIPEVVEVHVIPPTGDEDNLNTVWVVLTEELPEIIRSVTDAISDIELEYEELYEIRVVPDGSSVPQGAKAFLVKE